MGAANTLWVAGFDVIYGAQDYEFDKAHGIHSIPARFGVRKALMIARVFHALAWVILVAIGLMSKQLNVIYEIGMLVIGILFIIEHKLVSPDNLTNVKIASYQINQVISIVFLICGVLATVL